MYNNIKGLLVVLLVFLGSINFISNAQQFNVNQVDFKSIKVDNLSDAQIKQLLERAKSTNMSFQQLEAEAMSRGLPYSEAVKLRARVAEIEKGARVSDNSSVENERLFQKSEFLGTKKEIPELIDEKQTLRVYGHEFFNRTNLSFEPNINVPTPQKYVLGSGDQIIIEVWGASQQRYAVTISPDGFVSIPNLGVVLLNGLTIEKASQLIVSRLSTIYSGLRGPNPNTFANVSLGQIRSISVTIIGDIYQPGNYTLPALASAFNAIFLAGGPNEIGSFRNIRLIRNGDVVAELDLYEFFAKGQNVANVRLQDDDIIFVPTYNNHVIFDGEVKRPAIYELKNSETLSDLVSISGGFSAKGYSQRLKIFRKTTSQQKILDVEESLFSSFLMQNGDSIQVERVLDRFENLVTIQGAVFREGEYAYRDGLTLTKLIELADGLREDAFMSRASIYREMENLKVEVIPVDLNLFLSGNSEDILLKSNDLVFINSIFELEDTYTIQIFGEVADPKVYKYSENITLGELVRIAGGLKSSASLARVEVARRIQNPKALKSSAQTADVFTFPLDKQLNLTDEGASFVLNPFDMVFVRKSPDYVPQVSVKVEGQVNFPGEYVITKRNERISDLINRAGGFTTEAYIPGATLLRKVDQSKSHVLKKLASLQTKDTEIDIDEAIESKEQYIGINLKRIVSNPYGSDDLILNEGDILRIPKEYQTVRLSGALLHPVTTRYKANAGVRSYISQAGGFAENARKKKVYVVYANGSVDRTRSFMFIKSYPNVEPGAEIIVPQKPEKEGRTLQESLAIGSMASSIALIIVTILNQVK
jgi:protein involved in polysaccharide export with SLBB domain